MANEKRLIWDVDMKTAFREWFDHEDFRTMNQVIDDIPTVDAVEVVHGRWIHPKGYVVSNAFFCTNCNHEATSYRRIHPLVGGRCKADENGNFFYPPTMNYCPNCGAKMDGDGNEG